MRLPTEEREERYPDALFDELIAIEYWNQAAGLLSFSVGLPVADHAEVGGH